MAGPDSNDPASKSHVYESSKTSSDMSTSKSNVYDRPNPARRFMSQKSWILIILALVIAVVIWMLFMDVV